MIIFELRDREIHVGSYTARQSIGVILKQSVYQITRRVSPQVPVQFSWDKERIITTTPMGHGHPPIGYQTGGMLGEHSRTKSIRSEGQRTESERRVEQSTQSYNGADRRKLELAQSPGSRAG